MSRTGFRISDSGLRIGPCTCAAGVRARAIHDPRSTLQCAIVLILAVLLPSHGAAAQDVAVRFEVSPRETTIGVPVTLSIAIDNAQQFDTPVVGPIDGAAVQPVPGANRSSFTQIVNGRMTQRETTTLTYRVVPSREGTFTIPSITVKADGRSFVSEEVEISVTKSDSGDLLFVDIATDKQKAYVGQSLPLTLRVWIRPYFDQRLNRRMDENFMFGQIDFRNSDWGDFSDALSKLRDQLGQLRINVREVLRADAQGSKRSYFVYEIPMTLWPQQPGAIVLALPRMVVNYPQRLQRDDSFFGMGQMEVKDYRPISVTADPPSLAVIAPPAAGRPETFTGAVGKFDLAVSAKPVEAAVGDPITLSVTVADRTPDGGARIDLLPPPALDRIPELTEHFKMPSDPLAGAVRGSSKTFTQTLRARSDQVTRIPPIAYSYFDPDAEKYVTLIGDAIPVAIKPSASMSMNAVVGSDTSVAGNGRVAEPTDLTELSGGILANDSDVDAMLAQQRFAVSWTAIAGLALPPLMFAGVTMRRWSARHRIGNAVALRRRAARKRALHRIRNASGVQPREQAQAVIAALCDYTADRLNLPHGTLTAGDVSSLLRRRGAAEDLVAESDSILDACEMTVYAGGMGMDSADLLRRARACIDRMERSRWS